MKRKETYLSRDFRETAAQRFPARAKELNTAFDMRLSALLAENADASKEKQYHLKRQILPGIAAYETLQRVMPKDEALCSASSGHETCWNAGSWRVWQAAQLFDMILFHTRVCENGKKMEQPLENK